MQPIYQTIYICLDDSGKLSCKESYCVYGGLVFFSKNERDKFIVQYRKIVQSLKCNYCLENKCDSHSCPELKSYNIHPRHRRWIMNYIKKYFTISMVIDNRKIYPNIMNASASKGRYIDYCIRRLIKNTIDTLVKKKFIHPYKPVKLILEIDEQTTKSNGYYSLKDGIVEELLYGITNFNYGYFGVPILKNKFIVELGYRDSKKSMVIQASDFISGTVRRVMLQEERTSQDLSFLNCMLFLPE